MDQAARKSHLVPGYRPRFWHARFWHGMRAGTFWQLLRHARFRLSPSHAWLVLTLLPVTALNSVLCLLQNLVHGRAVAETELAGPPLFIIGHWRSGTTLLHELLMLDERFTAPNTFQCMCPNHFLLTESHAESVRFLLPGHRPMDTMAIGWDKPQEDEFALMNMGLPSPYSDLAFPHAPPVWPGSLSLDGLSAPQKAAWKQGLDTFLKRISLRDPRPILVKSPTHTARVKTLLELYPDARFAFIHRDPEAIYASTVKLWGALEEAHGLQGVNAAALPEKVLSGFEEMFSAFNQDRTMIPEGQFATLGYEALIADPVRSLSGLYARLGLGGFEAVKPKIETYFAARKDYRAGRYVLPAATRAEIARRWGPYLAAIGTDEPRKAKS